MAIDGSLDEAKALFIHIFLYSFENAECQRQVKKCRRDDEVYRQRSLVALPLPQHILDFVDIDQWLSSLRVGFSSRSFRALSIRPFLNVVR